MLYVLFQMATEGIEQFFTFAQQFVILAFLLQKFLQENMFTSYRAGATYINIMQKYNAGNQM